MVLVGGPSSSVDTSCFPNDFKIIRDGNFELLGGPVGSPEFCNKHTQDRVGKAPAKELVHKLGQLAFTKGLLLLSCGASVIRIAPPLVINAYDVDKGLEILDACLTELTA